MKTRLYCGLDLLVEYKVENNRAISNNIATPDALLSAPKDNSYLLAITYIHIYIYILYF